jgi:hypothetical protein
MILARFVLEAAVKEVLVVAALVALVLVVQVTLAEVVVEVDKNHVLQVCTIAAVRSMAVAPPIIRALTST